MMSEVIKNVRCIYCSKEYHHLFTYCHNCGSLTPYSGDTTNVGLIILQCLDSIQCNVGRSLLKNVLLATRKKYVLSNFTDNYFFGSLSSYFYSEDLLQRTDHLISEGFISKYTSDSYLKLPLIKLSEKGLLAIKNSDKEIIKEEIISMKS